MVTYRLLTSSNSEERHFLRFNTYSAMNIFLLIALKLFLIANSFAYQKQIEGYFEGHLVDGKSKLKLSIEIKKDNDELTGSFNIPASAVYRFPLKINLDSTEITMVLNGVIHFSGVVDKNKISGKVFFNNHSYDFIVMQSATTESLYKEEEVSFINGDITLAGTLRTPLKNGKHPAIFLLQGSGDADRMAESFYADFFASKGYSTLIYDKRGTGKSTGNWEITSFEEFASDALAGIHFLQSLTNVDPKKVGLWGRSHGGMIAPLAASLSRDVAFVINVSGNALPVTENIIYGMQSNMRAGGFPESIIKEATSYQIQKYKVAKTGLGWEAFQTRIKKLQAENATWLTQYAGIPKSLETLQFFWKTQFYYEPLIYWQKLTIPSLSIYGGLDKSQPVSQIDASLRKSLSKNKQASIKVFTTADHAILIWSTSGENSFPVLPKDYLTTLEKWMFKILIK